MDILVNDSDIRIARLTLGPWATNAYILTCPRTGASALVDAPADARTLIETLRGTQPQYILMTHGHGDHTGALAELCATLKVPLAIHPDNRMRLPVQPTVLLSDGDVLAVGDVKIEVLHAPGHTPGSVCFRIGRYLIAGDTVFPGGPGRTESPADLRRIISSITGKIFVLPDDTLIFPGHGDSTVLKKEKDEFAVFSSRPHDPGLCGDVLWMTS